ncbi:MAG: hypothetical protein ABI308_12355 [Mucilaginibacter sp.]
MEEIKKKYFYDFYYLIVILVYFSDIYIPSIRVGVFMSVVMLYLLYYLIKNRLFSLRNNLDLLVFFYILYNTISVLWFLLSGLPIDVFIMEYSNSILPIIAFYFIGRINRSDTQFYKNTWYALILCFVIGFYFQFTLPENYREFMARLDNTGGDDTALFILYFRSLLGVTATGSLSAIGVLLSLAIITVSRVKRGKIGLFICFMALILTFRRSALYVGVFAFLWMNYLAFFKFKVSKLRFFIFEILIVFLLIVFINSLDPDFLNGLSTRFASLSDAINERNGNWFEGVANANNIIIGDGLGKYGHKAALFTDNIMPDGNYFRIIAELGIVGITVFISIIVVAFVRGFADLKNNFLEIAIITMVCLQAVGSDIFSFQLVAPIFWYAIGRCSRMLPTFKKSKLEITKNINFQGTSALT